MQPPFSWCSHNHVHKLRAWHQFSLYMPWWDGVVSSPLAKARGRNQPLQSRVLYAFGGDKEWVDKHLLSLTRVIGHISSLTFRYSVKYSKCNS